MPTVPSAVATRVLNVVAAFVIIVSADCRLAICEVCVATVAEWPLTVAARVVVPVRSSAALTQPASVVAAVSAAVTRVASVAAAVSVLVTRAARVAAAVSAAVTRLLSAAAAL